MPKRRSQKSISPEKYIFAGLGLFAFLNLVALGIWLSDRIKSPTEPHPSPQPVYTPPLDGSNLLPLRSLTPLLNGITIDEIIVLDPAANAQARRVYALGEYIYLQTVFRKPSEQDHYGLNSSNTS